MHYDLEGIGLIILDKGKFIFALSKPKYWIKEKDRTLISYGCVGGRIEEGETIQEAATREAYEEISTKVEIISSKNSYLIDLDLKVHEINLNLGIKPLVIYFVKYPGKPGNPNEKDQCFIGKIYVLFAKLGGRPNPSSEVPAILWTDWNIVQGNNGSYIPISYFLKAGKIEKQIELPENACLYPMWTPEIIGKAFKKQELKNILQNFI
jgi:8-oxo-dGTP pyrophosphatase MutT (NUDIX family)